ncbi:hypothetical protein ACERK3_03490 [Phycisphaerales bacterium AB-hyl4]|uniref:Uncharacterized protein n=1 Tax=Natronomicrosphaera hydrolytica TaxID=3242702 RepID=A0ABV4U2E9_9BACT
MNPKPSGGALTTALYATCAFGLVPTSMVFDVLEPVLGQGVIAQACYWTTAIVAMAGLGRRCLAS